MNTNKLTSLRNLSLFTLVLMTAFSQSSTNALTLNNEMTTNLESERVTKSHFESMAASRLLGEINDQIEFKPEPKDVVEIDEDLYEQYTSILGLPEVDEPAPEFEQFYDDVPTREEFIATVAGSSGKNIVGVWAEGLFAFRVVGGSGIYVPDQINTASRYSEPRKYGADVLLIHNYLGGTRLYQMDHRPIYVIYSDGSFQKAQQVGSYWYETNKWSSSGLNGKFRPWDCVECGWPLSSTDVFNIHYTGRTGLVIQTSINTLSSNGIVITEFNFVSSN